MPAIAQYASGGDYSKVEPDVYPGTIVHCSVIMDKDNPQVPATDKYGKNRLLVKVQLDEDDDEGNPIELRRQLAISYGKNNSTGQHAALAVLIEAATGIKCGDPAQRHVTTEDLTGKSVRVRTANVEKDGTTYTNIADFLAPKRAARPAPAPAPKPAPAEDDNLDLDDLPF